MTKEKLAEILEQHNLWLSGNFAFYQTKFTAILHLTRIVANIA